MDRVIKFFVTGLRGFLRLTPSRQIAFVSVLVLSIGAMTAAFHFMNRIDYAVLYSDLASEDANTIALKLKEKNIPYRISYSGDRVLVPASRLSEARIDMASSDLTLGGGVGFELFDEKTFGVTEFVQKLNYQRALQGELARTISGLDEISGSRVHIVIPEKSIFAETRQNPSASVALRIKPGRSLNPSQVEGIVNLVARSVEGLNPDDVMVVDSSGVILSSKRPQSELAVMTSSQLEYQRSVERELSARVQSMLERVVGKGNVIATVSARLDFQKIQKTEEFFDPEEPVIRSSHRKTERSTSGRRGEESTVDPTGQEARAERLASTERTDEVIHYELGRTVSTSVRPLGDIEQLSVAVLVDGRYGQNEAGEEVYQPRTSQELVQMDDLVKKAVGFDQRRGDQVVITNIAFKRADLAGEEIPLERSWKDIIQAFMPVFKALLLLGALLAVVLLVLRPISRVIVAAGRETEFQHALPGSTAASIPELERQRERAVSALNMDNLNMDESDEVAMIKEMARRDSGTFTELIRNWLK
ncbi:MAG: flagellar basal-body MS-ring/collar protein FliF [Syntrophales bacterium]|nr:flagellar basal-body MS-ring/collar protein FliF [Syntrophales bacterium]